MLMGKGQEQGDNMLFLANDVTFRDKHAHEPSLTFCDFIRKSNIRWQENSVYTLQSNASEDSHYLLYWVM